MCQILSQVYACSHTKAICTNACPHALATSTSNPFLDVPPTPATPHTPVSPIYQAPDTPIRAPVPSPISPAHPQVQPHAQQTPSGGMNNDNNDNNINGEPKPAYCPAVRRTVKFLPHSKYPCLSCYMQPRWAQYRARWVNEYRSMHPGTRPEDLEQFSGVEIIPERVGLVNVAREMERMGDQSTAREASGGD
ncbi:hypothetical protein K504DRAFT_491469 [Pleomassaria siparia CBS 279.74]|uniref:Uncharacterized protein n=1 Tax=Pleomassaria siparia CBS 279.74 TaxID=1314801 RepID=A0A6G1K7E5_9PLEO|nr:hypothetical protein K504DRAFT_491469 [Pleomassaria siparia CBS 279.74]